MFTYSRRASLTANPTAQKLLQLMEQKNTNLSVAADVTSSQELYALIHAIGAEIAVLKTHIDIIEDFTPALLEEISKLAEKYQFLLFEDRKFADIGNTAKLQYEKGIYHIASWAQITNAHILPGVGIIQGLKEVGLPLGNGLLLLAELSSEGNFITSEYTQAAIKLAREQKDFVIGFICQHRLSNDENFIYMTPGIHIAAKGDSLGQKYITPEQAILERDSDVIIVGRGIYAAKNPQQAAKEYRERGWEAYKRKIKGILHGNTA